LVAAWLGLVAAWLGLVAAWLGLVAVWLGLVTAWLGLVTAWLGLVAAWLGLIITTSRFVAGILKILSSVNILYYIIKSPVRFWVWHISIPRKHN
jgi:hypothetical protein